MVLALLYAVQEQGGGGGGLIDQLPKPFQPSWGLAFWTLIVFAMLALALSRFVYPWIVQTTVEREQKIAKQLAEAERMHREAADRLEEQRQLLDSARGEAQAIVAEARQAAERERAGAIEKTRAEQDELLARAKREIEAERERAVADIRREAVDIAIAAAGKVVGQRLDGASDRKLVEDYISQIGSRA